MYGKTTLQCALQMYSKIPSTIIPLLKWAFRHSKEPGKHPRVSKKSCSQQIYSRRSKGVFHRELLAELADHLCWTSGIDPIVIKSVDIIITNMVEVWSVCSRHTWRSKEIKLILKTKIVSTLSPSWVHQRTSARKLSRSFSAHLWGKALKRVLQLTLSSVRCLP